MRIFKAIILGTLLLFPRVVNSQSIPAFSGAEGFGAVTVGGRGGEVYHVTNLNNSGPGSFREAVNATGPRTIVFDVSGIIWLNEGEEIQIINPYITIAGQTAPGEGILIAGETVNMGSGVSEVISRYIRIRRSFDIVKWADYIGCTAHCTPNPEGQCMVGMDATKNLIMDHMSVSWGTDENFSMYRRVLSTGLVPTKNITIQWCISSEALDPANHAFANTWGGQGFNAHHNLMACNTGRNPSLSFSHFIDYRNNVVFNWRDRTMDGAGKEAHVNVINNYYKPGPATGFNWDWSQPFPELYVRIVKPEIRTWDNWEELGLDKKTRYAGPGVIGWWYINGNIVEGYPEVSADNWEGRSKVSGTYYSGVQWDAVVAPYPGIGPAIGEEHPEWTGHTMIDHPEWAKVDTVITYAAWPEDPDDPEDGSGGGMFVMPRLPKVATQSAEAAYYAVLAGAGATLPVRDAVDERTLEMVRTGVATAGPRGNGIIIHPDEVGGYPEIKEVHRPANWDIDLDGMPGEWEETRGLDPNNSADRNDDYDNDGYTNLEEYLNDIGAFPAIQAIHWDGEENNRYAQIGNWDIAFQPSRFDTAIISGATVVVDAIDQHAGILKLTDQATLQITTGWIDLAGLFENGDGSKTEIGTSGSMIARDVINNGMFILTGDAGFTITGAFINNDTLDISQWNGFLPSGLINNGVIIDGQGVVSSSIPTVTISSPLMNELTESSTNFTLTAEASDTDGIVAVEFFYEDNSLGTDNSAPYSATWNNVPSGHFTITARASNSRITAVSAPVEFRATVSPEVTITSPGAEEEFVELSTITLQADASDTDGSISTVEFFMDSISMGTLYNSPYTLTLDSVNIGSYTITARATDNDGAISLSSAVNFTVVDSASFTAIEIPEAGSGLSARLYPVPVHDLLNIKFSKEPPEDWAISLYDVTGKQVLYRKIDGGCIHIVDLSTLTDGLYIIKISGKNLNEVARITKQ